LGSVKPKITKTEIHVTLVLHIVLYGCETWCMLIHWYIMVKQFWTLALKVWIR